METKNCPWCKEDFIKKEHQKPSDFRGQTHCSKKCMLLFRNKFNNPMNSSLIRHKITGENNYNWSGDKIKYFGLHNWIKKVLGKRPSNCLDCKCEGFEFKNGRWSIEYANISGNYIRDEKDWETLCRSCHRKKDNAKRKLK